jgi:hypothetical protein
MSGADITLDTGSVCQCLLRIPRLTLIRQRYDDIVDEVHLCEVSLWAWLNHSTQRQLSNLCGYASCRNPPRRPYDPSNTPALKLQGNRLKNVKNTAQYCSSVCVKRSHFYRESCLTNKTETLLEELDPLVSSPASSTSPLAGAPGPSAEPAPAPAVTSAAAMDIQIVEKPEAVKAPALPPSKDQADFEAPSLRNQKPAPRSAIAGGKLRGFKASPQPALLVTKPEDIPEEEQDEDIKAMLSAGLLLREELRSTGELG